MVLVAKSRKTASGFGARLRELREAAGITQATLADRVDMHYQAIARYERGAADPTWTTVVKLADALGVDIGEFRDQE